MNEWISELLLHDRTTPLPSLLQKTKKRGLRFIWIFLNKYSFVERGTLREKSLNPLTPMSDQERISSCPSTQHIDPAGLKPRILYQESSALTIRVLCLPAIGRTSSKCWYTTSNANLPAKCKHQYQLFKQYPFKVWKFFYWKLPRGDCTLRYFFCNCQH